MSKESMTSRAEWDTPTLILTHEPSIEAELGTISPQSSLYQGACSIEAAKKEHQDMVTVLKAAIPSAKILTIKEILKKDKYSLVELAKKATEIDTSSLDKFKAEQVQQEYEASLWIKTVDELMNQILLMPKMTITKDNRNTGLKQEIIIRPQYNLMFMRDPQIVTDKGVVMSRMNSEQRSLETLITEQVLKTLGTTPIYTVQEPGFLEGGDYIPAGKRAYLGISSRTNMAAAKQLIENNAFGADEIVLVDLSYKNQDEMHLDTVFNITSKDTYVIMQSLLEQGGEKEAYVKIYTRNDDGSYSEKSQDETYDASLYRYLLAHTDDNKIARFTKEMQAAYASNFLTVAPNKIIGVDIAAKKKMQRIYRGVEFNTGRPTIGFPVEYADKTPIDYKRLDAEFYAELDRVSIKYTKVNLNNLNLMYGGIHCCTQVFRG